MAIGTSVHLAVLVVFAAMAGGVVVANPRERPMVAFTTRRRRPGGELQLRHRREDPQGPADPQDGPDL